ncbi:hypothetical protein VNO78_21433 [Psophocarpus tetragonolobus]|uniref:Uncharacterized protein n=1 Tax=Psophocarpus tetragonolobus TaxID=3891 RepID=A0AAN9SB36_PSOTE
MILLCAMKNSIKVKWVTTIKDTMMKTRHLDEYKCPYAVFVSKALERYGVYTTNKARDVHFVKDRTLKIMKLIKTDEGWMTKEYMQVEDEDESMEPKLLTPFEEMILK